MWREQSAVLCIHPPETPHPFAGAGRRRPASRFLREQHLPAKQVRALRMGSAMPCSAAASDNRRLRHHARRRQEPLHGRDGSRSGANPGCTHPVLREGLLEGGCLATALPWRISWKSGPVSRESAISASRGRAAPCPIEDEANRCSTDAGDGAAAPRAPQPSSLGWSTQWHASPEPRVIANLATASSGRPPPTLRRMPRDHNPGHRADPSTDRPSVRQLVHLPRSARGTCEVLPLGLDILRAVRAGWPQADFRHRNEPAITLRTAVRCGRRHFLAQGSDIVALLRSRQNAEALARQSRAVPPAATIAVRLSKTRLEVASSALPRISPISSDPRPYPRKGYPG